MTVRFNGYSSENGFDLHTVYGCTHIHIKENVEECCRYYREEKLAGVRVNPERGYSHESLEPLVRFGHDITHLSLLQPYRPFDLAPLYGLKKLESLKINGPCNLELERFENLRAFSGELDDGLELGDSPRLESLGLRMVPRGRDIDELPRLPTLRSLTIAESRLYELPRLSAFIPNAQWLSLYYCRKLASIAGVSTLDHLRVFHADSCRNVRDHDALSRCKRLESIRLNDCGTIASIRFIAGLPALKELRFVGTRVTDGDVSELLKLKFVGFNRGRNYTHTPEHVDSVLRPKGGSAVTRFGDPTNPYSVGLTALNG